MSLCHHTVLVCHFSEGYSASNLQLHIDIYRPLRQEIPLGNPRQGNPQNKDRTNRTKIVFLGSEKGRGPIAHPSLAIAQWDVPERFNNELTGHDSHTYCLYLGMAMNSFSQFDEKKKTGVRIIASGGIFDQGELHRAWNYRAFFIFRVQYPV